MRMRQSHRFRHTIAIISLLAGFASACVWIVNRPEVLAHALAIANIKSDWNVKVDRFRWRPLASSIEIDGISAVHATSGKSARIEGVDISYRLLGLLRGRFVIDELTLDGVDLVLPPRQGPKEKGVRRRIDPARFLIFKHIELVEGKVRGLAVEFGKDAKLSSDEMRISLIPSIFGASRLAVRTDGVKLEKAARSILTAGFISMKTSTRIENWVSEFPYVNSFSGDLKVQDANVEGASIDSVGAELTFDDDKLSLSDLDISIGGRRLVGSATADLASENFELSINMPSPINLPHIGKDLKTIDTGGALSGSIRLKGRGLVPSRTGGEGIADITHRFSASPENPVRIRFDVSWHNSVFTIPEALVSVGEDIVKASGTIDVPGKRMEISGLGKNFPIEHLFDKFKNPHLARIFGRSDFTASITGWGKDFKAHVEGTTFDGGWKPIKARTILTVLDATYNDLSLEGKVMQDGMEVGAADLHIKLGARMADGRRYKEIDLTAGVTDIDLAYPMEELGLDGRGNGTIKIEGPHTNFTGDASAEIDGGRFHGLSFDHASTELDITRRHLEFRDIRLAMPKSELSKFSGVLEADLSPGRMRLHGEPVEGLIVDATYAYAPKRWNIAKLDWNDPDRPGEALSVRGSLVSGGAINISADGAFDASLLSAVTSYVRDNAGPVTIDLDLRGTTKDPRAYGKLAFEKTSITLRNPRVELESLSGLVRFDGSRISFDDMVAEIEDGTAKLSGYLDHRGLKPAYADLKLDAKAMRYRSEDGAFNLELDGDLALEGKYPEPFLTGNVTIVDGRYTKDFTIIDILTTKKKKKKKAVPEERKGDFNPRLELHVRSSGDMEIKNNIGEIFLNVNVDIEGTRLKPIVTGSINTSDGFVDYMGLAFEITKGFVEFRGEGRKAYLEIYAEKEVRVYNISLIVYGPVDNLAFDLSASSPYGPLEKHDVVSLLLFGSTEEEREEAKRGKGRFGASVAAASVGGVVGGPIQRFAGIDTFKLGAAEADSTAISRMEIGKEVSDRLTVQFATDIGVDNAVQTFAAEYLITDNLLIKGQRSTDSDYKISGILRFRLR